MIAVFHTTTESFGRDVLNSPVPVLVDFYADWCGPCRMLAPALDRLAAEFSGKARIVKVNVDREPAPVSQFHVSSIPNLAFLVDGEIVGQSAGAPTEAALRRALSQLIGQAV